MNSIFNQSSSVLAHMSDEELIACLHSEGFVTMPPIVRALAERLETACTERQQIEDELGDEIESLRKQMRAFVDEFREGINELDDKLTSCVTDIENASRQLDALAMDARILTDDRIPTPFYDVSNESPDDQVVVKRGTLDALQDRLDTIGKSLNELCIGDYFPDAPEI